LSQGKQVFSTDQRFLLTAVINRIIPPNENMPGAGDLGIGAYIENVAAANSVLTRLFNDGLAEISVAAGQRSTEVFNGLSDQSKDELLRVVETAHPAFFDQLVLQTYNGYYTNPEVFKAIGYELPDPPKPGDQPELLDVSLLDQQHRREPFWKKV